MKLLTFARKTKEMAREILYGWYTKTLSAEELLACSGGSFTMIGANLDEYFPFCARRANLADIQRRQDGLPALVMEDDTWHFTPMGPEDALVCGCCRLRTAPGSGLVLSEQPRVTMLFHAEGEQIYLRHSSDHAADGAVLCDGDREAAACGNPHSARGYGFPQGQ